MSVMSRKALRSLSVLVAEDHPVNQRLVSEILRERGHVPTLAVTGIDAVRLFERAAFDAILMDGQMPGMDGYAATREIRRLELARGGRIAIIAVTANVGPHERQACLQAGMDDYIAKPIDPDLLLDCLESAVAMGDRAPAAAIPALANTTSAPADGAIPGVAVFNRRIALERVRGKHVFLCQLTRMFTNELPEVLAAIGAATVAGNAVQLESLAHRLRGAAITVGGEALAAVAETLEKTAGRGAMRDVPALVAQLHANAAQLCGALDDFAREGNPAFADQGAGAGAPARLR